MAEHNHSGRLAAAARDAEQQAHAEPRDLFLIQNLDRNAALDRQRLRAPRELARRQRIARLIGELARKIAALAQQPAARHRLAGSSKLVVGRAAHGDRPGGGPGRRRIVGLVTARVEL